MKFIENLKYKEGEMEFNKENFEKSKQKIIEIINRVSEKEIKEWEKSENIFKGWDIFRLMDVCLLLLAPFNFKVSDKDIYNAANAVGHKFMKQNSMARLLWDGTLRGKTYGWPTRSSLDHYMNLNHFFVPLPRQKKIFFEWFKVREHLVLLESRYHDDAFIILKLDPDILKEMFQVAWWIGEELKNRE